MKKNSKLALTVRDITLIGMMVAIIEVCKVAMTHLPNIELTTFWVIMFSLYLGKRIYYAIPAFILIEGAIYGFGLWWIMYLYLWPLVAIATRFIRKSDSVLTFSIFSGTVGLLFGFLGAIPYIFIGASDGGLMNGFRVAAAWWVAGIPWDLVHGAGNFLLMLVLYHPITLVMKQTKRFTDIV